MQSAVQTGQGPYVSDVRTAVYGAKQLGVLLLALMLTACAGPSGIVPIDDRGRGGGKQMQTVTSGTHRVQRGETLYQIAFRYGWDWKELARANNMREPYTIYPGQEISLRPQGGSRAVAPPLSTSRPSTPRISTPSAPDPTPVVVRPAPSKPVATPNLPARVSGWNWPAQGTLISRFQSNGSLNKGIDIAGKQGQPIKAAADGAVVYAGRGLLGYGEMIIVKHDETYLSAYAHNSLLMVKEGDRVRSGQTIAEMGSTGTDRVKLHFEIRRKGQPVDPLVYLPKL
ncbi:lipoprotein NlpD/LppB [Halopseudomonas salina]|uniref:Lipoprotein NlpD/LppB n=1 Tax=Halopseudomonas salina TaxID=1323744 RepID=A0ABQ1PKA3_9GAMM|nr:lipoprotein NlpD/LppB [Halopseudomonas salina]